MGFWDTITDLVEAATPWSTAEAEAPPEDKDDAQEEPEEEEDEEEDEDEIVDPKEKLEEECANSKQCSSAKHHYDECVERVTGASDDDEGEDCVEEFFHLAHCATQCAAPKLWSQLK
ncbi:ubiquinol--cytochrome-c reductase subunit 6 [Eutypa lata]|nr:ubiquinol--cytochrome-c reductase subunit 6 [Eutypa lata]